MLYSVHIQHEAQQDIQDAYDWYEKQLPNLGERFLNDFYSMLDKISNHPEYYGFAFDDFRDAGLKNFPYLIVFKIMGNKVYINSVRHKKRKPKL